MSHYVSIDIGGTAIKHGIINSSHQIVENSELPSHGNLGGPHLVSCVISIIKEYRKKYPLKAVGVSTAGMVDPIKGEITYSGKQIPNYTGVNWKQIINENFGLPCEVENDVNCAGLSEALVGAGKDYQSSLCVTIGTGIGACMVVDKKVFRGSMGAAFEVGYMHLGEGQFQDLASTTALIHNVARRKNLSPPKIDGRTIFQLAKTGDTVCIEEIHSLIDHIALGISNICYVVNPQIVILGGGIMEQQDYIRPILKVALKKYLLPHILSHTAFEFAQNKNHAGMLGAYYNLISVQKPN